eukprot:TRINITY_DN12415_c4_g3_i12.p1 TRINITY_DN12415_c4_g3~~TRINITY_DN12415_c4_g3_i12.p1  ORF type:complete len:483 (+),score=58.73 TRINITY_DN12415_c4_g3_i12:1473-2921(+)
MRRPSSSHGIDRVQFIGVSSGKRPALLYCYNIPAPVLLFLYRIVRMYLQSWHLNRWSAVFIVYQLTASQSCQFIPNADSCGPGYSLGVVINQTECCSKCVLSQDCALAVYNIHTRLCTAKSNSTKAIESNSSTVCILGQQPSSLKARLGVTHWNGCYNRSTAPFLLDGSNKIKSLGFKTIKLALTKPASNYIWNSHWPADDSWRSVAEIANHSYYRAVFEDPAFSVYVLETFSTVSIQDNNYFRHGVTAAQIQEEEEQFHQLSRLFMHLYPNKRFILQNWEGDWAIRGANKTSPPSNDAIEGMIAWLRARQAGVLKARKETGMTNVKLACEVNLVYQAMQGTRNVINGVVPHVKLDLLSYSAYDTQCKIGVFAQALAFIEAHHNKTDLSPSPGLYIGEYGLPLNTVSDVAAQVCIRSATTTAIEFGAQHLLYWEVYGNEPRAGGRCNAQSGRITNESALNGFWLESPDGTRPWVTSYLQSLV